jgi:hypothetical protein
MNVPRPLSPPFQSPFASFAVDMARQHAAALQWQREYEEAMRGLPENTLTPEDINRLAAIDAEKKSEGRAMRPFRTNFKE